MRTSVNVLLLSLQVYNCFLIKIHTYASFWFRSLPFKKQALRFDCFSNIFLCVEWDFYCCILLNTWIPDDFKWNIASMRVTDLCSRTQPQTHHWAEEATCEMINNISYPGNQIQGCFQKCSHSISVISTDFQIRYHVSYYLLHCICKLLVLKSHKHNLAGLFLTF